MNKIEIPIYYTEEKGKILLDEEGMRKEFETKLKDLDYCGSCEEFINQIDLGDGSYGCPLCKTNHNIITFYNGDEE